jgi:hypothetical protein
MSIRDRSSRSRWTARVGCKTRSKSALQDVNNRVERGDCADFDVKRPVKHFDPMRGVHAAPAHFLQQLYARIVQNKNVFFLRHVN